MDPQTLTGLDSPAHGAGSGARLARTYTRARPRTRRTVTLDVPCGPEVLKKLLRSEMLVDYRPHAGIRVSPHFYKMEDEVDRVVEEIADNLRRA